MEYVIAVIDNSYCCLTEKEANKHQAEPLTGGAAALGAWRLTRCQDEKQATRATRWLKANLEAVHEYAYQMGMEDGKNTPRPPVAPEHELEEVIAE